MLRLENGSKVFGATRVLDNITLEIAPGTITGLAGPSGGGKSTLLRCLQGLETLSSGTLHTQGARGFMFQDFQLFPHMNVLDNLTYAPQCHNAKVDHARHALALLENLGLLGKEKHFPHELSGGQKQRVALARCLMMHPEYLLCDEPTSGLDVATIQDVVNLLESVRRKGVTMIIASHDLDFLTQVADRIVVLSQGSLALDAHPKTMDDPIKTLKTYY
jgi:polar amino acid transport system ATP-binding protein